MALPEVVDNPTPKRVAAYLIEAVVSYGVGDEIDALEQRHGVKLSKKQREEVVRHFTAFADRVKKHVLGPTLGY